MRSRGGRGSFPWLLLLRIVPLDWWIGACAVCGLRGNEAAHPAAGCTDVVCSSGTRGRVPPRGSEWATPGRKFQFVPAAMAPEQDASISVFNPALRFGRK